MIRIKIIAIGSIKEDYYSKAIAEYKKRLTSSIKLDIIALKEMNFPDIEKTKTSEGELILSKIKKDDYVITLEINGKLNTSEELASLIKNHYTYSSKEIIFVVGGSNGLGDNVLKRSNYRLSFGKMTYPHQLMRVILVEQIYRSVMINNNKKYHK